MLGDDLRKFATRADEALLLAQSLMKKSSSSRSRFVSFFRVSRLPDSEIGGPMYRFLETSRTVIDVILWLSLSVSLVVPWETSSENHLQALMTAIDGRARMDRRSSVDLQRLPFEDIGHKDSIELTCYLELAPGYPARRLPAAPPRRLPALLHLRHACPPWDDGDSEI
ncbi:hypothetical protein DFH09DRAFT_1077509 [Mycena vulgaris]|nr:hypothetical protein DFH09DRAFT_1077509 [Mycena vulgaris]